MPVSKRNRLVSLTKTAKKTTDVKSTLIEKIRDSVDNFQRVFVFRFENMRSAKFKDVRAELNDSRFFLGKNKVMRVALGRDDTDEYRDGLAELGSHLVGSVGLLATNRPVEEIQKYFAGLTFADYARAGGIATETVEVPEGKIDTLQSSMHEYLRRLGLPVDLNHGNLIVSRPYTICNEGDTLTVEQARLLQLFDHKLANFQVSFVCVWEDGAVTMLEDEDAAGGSDDDEEDGDDDDEDDDM